MHISTLYNCDLQSLSDHWSDGFRKTSKQDEESKRGANKEIAILKGNSDVIFEASLVS